MTPVDKDDFEDAELARRLAAMPQPEPSAELDAAIFAQVQKDLAPGPDAANDPATEPAAEAPRPGLLRRYRAPLAFAASLAGVMILLPVWRTTRQKELVPVEVSIIPVETRMLEAPSPNVESAAPSAVIADKKLDAMPAPKMEMPASPPPPPVPSPESAAAAAAAPEFEPRPAPAPAPAAESDLRARQAPVPGIAPSHESPKEWLQSIERLLDAGESGPAAEQWKRFRKAHPDYPVADTLAERLKALE